MSKNSGIPLKGVDKLPDVCDVNTFRKFLAKNNAGAFPGQGTDSIKRVMAPKEDTVKVFIEPHPDEGFFIPYNVPSKKRAYKPTRNNKKYNHDGNKLTVSTTLGMAKQDHIIRYEKITAEYWQRHAAEFRELIGIERPVYVEMFFIRSTKATRWDFNNLSQMVCDMMTQYGWIEDDNIENLIAVPPFKGAKWMTDPDNPGVLIKKLNITTIDKFQMKAIKADQNEMARLTNFVVEHHPSPGKILGGSSVDVCIDLLKKQWGLV